MFHSRSIANVVVAVSLAAAACANKAEKPDPDVAAQTETETAEPVVKDVEFPAAGMTIKGTITRPAGKGPFPAVAIAAGSGPTDRNWESPMLPGDNGSGELLAEALAGRGIVVLRYDKRGTGKTGMPTAAVTWSDYIAELSQAAKLLSEQDYVSDIYIAGHSEGGAHALRVAENPPVPIAGVILLSTAGRSLREIVLWQIGNQLKMSGLNPAAADAEMAALTGALDKIAAGEPVIPNKVGQLPGIHQFVAALQAPASVGFARKLLVYDPASSFAKFDAPVLVLSGTADIQVDPELDAKPLHEAAVAAGRDAKLQLVPMADHVLKHEATPREQLTPEVGLRYNEPGRKLADGVVDAIVTFVGRDN